MEPSRGGGAALFFCSVAVFPAGGDHLRAARRPRPHWQAFFGVGLLEIGRSLFFLLAGAGSCTYVAGR